MKLVIFSDIHGNIYSLEKALREMEKYNPDNYLFLGDMAGYYYYQNECIDLLSELPNLTSLKGNHDENFLKAISDKVLLQKLTTQYGKSYNLLKQNITGKSLKYLQSMQLFEKNNIYEAYHGSPYDYLNEYIYPDNQLFIPNTTTTPFLFMGHTHYFMKKIIKDTIVVNPGSIGQPRDYNKPSFIVVDTISKDIELIRYNYDTSLLKNKVHSLRDQEYLIKILERKNK